MAAKAQSKQSQKLSKLKAENTKLKAENRQLNQAVKRRDQQKKHNLLNLIRKSGVILLLALAIVLLTIGNMFFWFGNTVIKQDRFVAATEPIIEDHAVQQSMALYVTNQIFNNVDVQAITEEVLPPRAAFLAPQLASQLRTVTQTALQKALAKPELQAKWNEVQARQHQRLISFAEQYKGDGTLSLNDVFDRVTASLKDTRLAFLADKSLPPNYGEITVVSAPWLPVFHNVVTNIDTWRILAIGLLIVSIAAATWLSRRRRKTIYTFCVFATGLLFVSLIAFRVARESVIAKADPQYQEGVRQALEIFFASFTVQTTTIMAGLLLVAFVSWVSGPSKNARRLKKRLQLLLNGKLRSQLLGERQNGFLDWINTHKRTLQWTSVIFITLLMLWTRLTFKTLLVFGLLMLLVILTIEFIAGPPRRD